MATGSANCDLLIAGGGITGASIARDAALRGMRTVLVELGDFASGTSSRSSRLLHGGLRYLAQGHIGLVREASHEKMTLSKIAPHLCDPLRFLFPVWKGNPYPLWQMSIGVHLYDLLCGKRNLGKSASHGAAEAETIAPGLAREGLKGAVSYFDGLTNDARLVMDTLTSAQTAGAELLNYTRMVSAERTGTEWVCTLRDEESSRTSTLRARAVANATGAWAQGFAQSSVHLRLTKGIHLVIDRARLPVTTAVVLTQGDRILFVIPWGERVILGTTDTDYSGDPAQVRTDPEDATYVLTVVNRGFPKARITTADVIATWAGVRPLIAPHKQKAGAPSDLSRQHEIRMPQPGWFDIAGGKLTTARLMAEQTVDRVAAELKMSVARSVTAERAIVNGDPACGVLPPEYGRAAIQRVCTREWPRHLDDVLLRRTSWHYYYGARVTDEVSRWMAEALHWDESQRLAEVARFEATTQPNVR